mmetsp:Transcript_75037/g.195189  ORF Transcript_75037/g.195189 Transcript_75037/m.195189 type:complete len:277 (-) Transcript_75037:148-978(-)
MPQEADEAAVGPEVRRWEAVEDLGDPQRGHPREQAENHLGIDVVHDSGGLPAVAGVRQQRGERGRGLLHEFQHGGDSVFLRCVHEHHSGTRWAAENDVQLPRLNFVDDSGNAARVRLLQDDHQGLVQRGVVQQRRERARELPRRAMLQQLREGGPERLGRALVAKTLEQADLAVAQQGDEAGGAREDPEPGEVRVPRDQSDRGAWRGQMVLSCDEVLNAAQATRAAFCFQRLGEGRLVPHETHWPHREDLRRPPPHSGSAAAAAVAAPGARRPRCR